LISRDQQLHVYWTLLPGRVGTHLGRGGTVSSAKIKDLTELHPVAASGMGLVGAQNVLSPSPHRETE